MPTETSTQRERVLHAVRGHGRVLDHLRPDLRLLVGAEEGVVHQVPVVPRDVARRPDGIQDLQVALRHKPKGPPALLSVDCWRTERDAGGRRDCASEDLPATETIHPALLWDGSIDTLKTTEPAILGLC